VIFVIGVIVNTVAVIIGSLIGVLCKKGIPERVSNTVMLGVGLCVIYIGVDGMLEAAPAVPEGVFLSAGLIKILIMILSMALGTLIGELVDIDRRVCELGDKLERRFSPKSADPKDDGQGKFAKGFVACSLLFCVGAMAVNGAIQDGLGNPDILLAKTVIDAISCFIMATTLGIGCAFSAFFVLAYQGAIAVLGYFLESVIPASTISYMSVTGSLVIIFIGTNMLKITNVKTANMVPAIFLPLALAPVFELFL
jgi:uncharacterized membrane protein YqgA involved in biofilm formation